MILDGYKNHNASFKAEKQLLLAIRAGNNRVK